MGKNLWKGEQGESWRAAAARKVLPGEKGCLQLPAAAHAEAQCAEQPLLHVHWLITGLRVSQLGLLWVPWLSASKAELSSTMLG